MELQVTGTNMELTAAVRSYVERKLSKLNRHLPNIIESRVELSEENTKSPQQRYLVRVTVDGNGAVFHGEQRGEDLFQAIDRVTAAIIRQMEHHKGKLYERGRGSSLVRGELAEEAAEPAQAKTAKAAKQVAKVKRFIIKPMTISEASAQMELLGHDFFLFFDADAEELKLLYRRKDGDYGLIVPELG